MQAQIPANNPNFSRFAEIVQAQLKEIGINVEITPSPNLLTTFFQNKQGDFVTTLWPARPDPSVTIGRNFTPNQVTNAGNNLSPEIPIALGRDPGGADAGGRSTRLQEGGQHHRRQGVRGPGVLPDARPTCTATYVVSDDWQLYGSCQGVDFSKVAITNAKK